METVLCVFNVVWPWVSVPLVAVLFVLLVSEAANLFRGINEELEDGGASWKDLRSASLEGRGASREELDD